MSIDSKLVIKQAEAGVANNRRLHQKAGPGQYEDSYFQLFLAYLASDLKPAPASAMAHTAFWPYGVFLLQSRTTQRKDDYLAAMQTYAKSCHRHLEWI